MTLTQDASHYPRCALWRLLCAARDAEVDRVGDRGLIGTRDATAVTRALAAARLDGRGVLSRDATLEDIFLRLTSRALVE